MEKVHSNWKQNGAAENTGVTENNADKDEVWDTKRNENMKYSKHHSGDKNRAMNSHMILKSCNAELATE